MTIPRTARCACLSKGVKRAGKGKEGGGEGETTAVCARRMIVWVGWPGGRGGGRGGDEETQDMNYRLERTAGLVVVFSTWRLCPTRWLSCFLFFFLFASFSSSSSSSFSSSLRWCRHFVGFNSHRRCRRFKPLVKVGLREPLVKWRVTRVWDMLTSSDWFHRWRGVHNILVAEKVMVFI